MREPLSSTAGAGGPSASAKPCPPASRLSAALSFENMACNGTMPPAPGITCGLSRACGSMSTALGRRGLVGERKPWRAPWRPALRQASIPELLAQNALVEAVARVEQHLHGDAVIHSDVD